MRVTVLRPAPGASRGPSSRRISVTFTDDALPLPLRFYFVSIETVNDETGEIHNVELRHVGLSIGDEALDDESAVALPELPATMLRRVVERYPHWLELAHAHANVQLDESLSDMVRGTRRVKPARIDADWLRMITNEYRHHVEAGEPAPVTTIAQSHGVSPSAASRWVKAARERGFLDTKGA